MSWAGPTGQRNGVLPARMHFSAPQPVAGGSAALCTDGERSCATASGGGGVCASQPASPSWLVLDLGVAALVRAVAIFAPASGSASTLRSFDVRVGPTPLG